MKHYANHWKTTQILKRSFHRASASEFRVKNSTPHFALIAARVETLFDCAARPGAFHAKMPVRFRSLSTENERRKKYRSLQPVSAETALTRRNSWGHVCPRFPEQFFRNFRRKRGRRRPLNNNFSRFGTSHQENAEVPRGGRFSCCS